MDAPQQSATPRLSVQDVQRLHRLLEGDPRVEQMILDFIRAKYGAKGLFYIPKPVAEQIFQRPGDFLRSVKQHCEPKLFY